MDALLGMIGSTQDGRKTATAGCTCKQVAGYSSSAFDAASAVPHLHRLMEQLMTQHLARFKPRTNSTMFAPEQLR
eukprot:137180-Amphidinium_carterae.1